ncbi:MAG: hypothetical protein ACYC2O_10365 [Microthrixaceae bacterium]
MSEPDDRAVRWALAATATARLTAALDAVLGDRLVPTAGERADYFADGVSLDAFAVLERCPRRLAHPPDDYVDEVATVRRRIGLMVMRRLATATHDGRLPASSTEPIAVAVRHVMDEREDWPGPLRRWVDGLDRGGVAAVHAAVVTWCHGASRVVRGKRDGIVWSDPAQPSKWNVPGRLVQLRGSVDATIGSVVRGEKLLVLRDAAPGAADRLRAGYLGLWRSAGTGCAPVRVTLASPASGGREQLAVTSDLLDLAVDRVVEVVGHRADPDQAPPMVGRGCRHCHLLDVCEEGAEHVGTSGISSPR